MPIRRGSLPFVALLILSADLHRRLHHHHHHHRQPVQTEMVALLDHRRPLTEVAALLAHQPITVPLLLLLMEVVTPLLHLPAETLLPLQSLAPLVTVISHPTQLPIQELQELLPTIQDVVAHPHLPVKDPPAHPVQPMVPLQILPLPQRLLTTVCGPQRPLAVVLLPLHCHRRDVIDPNLKTTSLKGVHLEWFAEEILVDYECCIFYVVFVLFAEKTGHVCLLDDQ